ncbi:MAG TPA: hypothetical protein VMD97_06890 [Candidatus Aquilonibacter sp.]|nr:hypothetical protein [Candidatus Aquilonibacter sp.]
MAQAAERPQRQQPQPWVTISLGSLGVPTMPPAMLKVGSSMLTLDLVDDTHLLLTFSSRGLVPRVPGDPPTDEDRMVTAEVVELPTGRIVATKDWHMHDHARYLWRLGEGRFMVRSRNSLFVITPEALLKTADPLKPLTFPNRAGTPVAAMVSPDNVMLTVETALPAKKPGAQAIDAGLMIEDLRPQIALDFYRMTGGDEPGQPLTMTQVGMVRAPDPLVLPMDSDGYLWPGDPQRGRWPVSFNEFGGREVKIGAVDSSCSPRLQMVSRFEFLAFTCMASESRTKMKAYGMDGHETWEESFGASYGLPEFAFAPAAGRFAISRISSVVTDDEFAGAAGVPDGATQEVRVYQTESGDLLLKTPTSPVTRFAENFDLSEDGLVAAVVNDGAIEVYKLPPPDKQELKDLALAKSFSPPVSEAAVSFARLEASADAAKGDIAAADQGETAGSGGGGNAARVTPVADVSSAGPGGGPEPVAGDVTRVKPEPAAATDAAVAKQGGVAGASPNAEVKTASASNDAAEGITDAEAARALGARIPTAQPAAKGAPASAGSATKDNEAALKGAAAAQASGDAIDAAPRKPPTLLEPGETVEQVKGSGPPQ